MSAFELNPLPPSIDLETKPILKKLVKAHRYLAELKGIAATIPNENILIQTLTLQEAKESSEIENIVTTHDELFKAQLSGESVPPATKEVAQYADALRVGFESVRANKLITLNLIIEIHMTLEKNSAGFRKLPGTTLRNQTTGEVVYTPPQHAERIEKLMGDLELFINDPKRLDADPLVKMALIHYQFESTHPFYDGNGRTGRIINILYLVANDLLNLPILYLSRFIIQNKLEYYRLLQGVRTNNDWEAWVLFMLEGVVQTAQQTTWIISEIRTLMLNYKHQIRSQFPRFYSQDLINNLFRHPYTKIAVLQHELSVSRLTASRYLEKLVEAGLLAKRRVGRTNYYLNTPLITLFLTLSAPSKNTTTSPIQPTTES